MTTTEAPEHEAGSDADLLAALRGADEALRAQEIARLQLTIEWSLQHQVEPDDPDGEEPASLYEFPLISCDGDGFYDRCVPIAGSGCPLISEFAVMDLAATLGMSTYAGKVFLGRALELRYRLPKLWERVISGEIPVWRTHRIVDQTMSLSLEAATWVDDKLAGVVGNISGRVTDNLMAEALAIFDPEKAAEQTRKAQDRRHVTIGGTVLGEELGGHVEVSAVVSVPDALDFGTAIATKARELLDLGCTEDLDARRSMALGEMARQQLAFDLSQAEQEPSPTQGRSVNLVVHISDAAFTAAGFMVGRVENTGEPVDAEMIREWCGTGGTITVQPLIDLNDTVHVEQYEVPDRIKRRVQAIHQTCVFPSCGKHATKSSTDCDHIHPYGEGGATCTCNLAPLCRPHHRAKTHGGFRYRRRGPGDHEWTLPSGYTVIRDHLGTHRPQAPELPDPPEQ